MKKPDWKPQNPWFYGAFPVCRNYTVRAYLRRELHPRRWWYQNCAKQSRSRDRRFHPWCLRSFHRRYALGQRAAYGRLHYKCSQFIKGTIKGKRRFRATKKPWSYWNFKAFSVVRGTGLEPVTPCTSSIKIKVLKALIYLTFFTFQTIKGATNYTWKGQWSYEESQEGFNFLVTLFLLWYIFFTSLNQLNKHFLSHQEMR